MSAVDPNVPSEEDDSEKVDTSLKAKLRTVIKYFIIIVLLIIIGGGIFTLIEEPSSLHSIEEQKSELKEVEMFFNHNETVLLYLKKHYGVFDDSNYQNNWMLESSCFFAFTIATTIGYGSFAPATDGGKVFAIIYACFSIPITGACLVVLADIVLDFLKKIIAKFTLNAMRDSFNAFDKDNSKSLDKDEVKQAIQLLNASKSDSEFDDAWKAVGSISNDELNFQQFKVFCKNLHIDLNGFAQEQKKVRVTVLAIFLWILGGAGFVSLAENWTYGEGFYFTFITLTTVGLGDYAPSTLSGSVITVIVSVIGLGLLAILLGIIGEIMEKESEIMKRKAIEIKNRASSSGRSFSSSGSSHLSIKKPRSTLNPLQFPEQYTKTTV